MSPYVKPMYQIVYKLTENGLGLLENRLQQIEIDRKIQVEKINADAAVRRASLMGFKPVNSLDQIRILLNEKIIAEVKRNKLRHIDVADIARIPRTRVTAIMNRRLERITVDCLVQILNILGILTELNLK